MRVLVIGGTGLVGSQVAAKLADLGADVRVLTRNPAKAAALPAGHTGVVGNLDSISVLRREMSAADAVFLMSPPQDSLSFQSLNAIAVAAECRPGKVVMMTAVNIDDLLVGVGHCGGLWPSEVALARSGLSHTILRPNYFFQNDERQRDNMLRNGEYGAPIGDIGVSRCDVRDIVDAAIAGFQNPGLGERYAISGPDVLNGEMTAAIWSDALGRPVRYGGHADMAQIEAFMCSTGIPEHWAFDLCKMYEVFQRVGLAATAEELDRLARLLGRDLRSFKAYAAESAARWSVEPGVAKA